jgi:hypothetical protein
MRGFRLVPILVTASFSIAFAASTLAAPTPDQSCRSAKLKAAGKYAAALLGCESKAAKDGIATDTNCLSKGDLKRSGAFTDAETKKGSACNGLDATSKSIVDESAADVGERVPVPSGGGDCASAVRKSAGKFASGLLGAWSKFTTGGDAAKREEALTKSREKLASAIAKAETKTGCTASGLGETVRTAVEDGVAPLIACIASSGDCIEAIATVSAGGSATTDPDASGPDETEPMTGEVETPNAGAVVLRVIDSNSEIPNGFAVLGNQFDITAPPASVADPLVLTFVLDASVLPPDPNDVAITRDGTFVEACSGAPGTAGPDPCLQSRTVLGSGDLELVVLSSHASLWTPLVEAPLTCPTKMLWELRADSVGDDRATELDVGWTGNGHDKDWVSGSPVTFAMDCHGATQSPCGTCDVTGFDPSAGNCRCANDSRTICDEPLVADADDCGGAVCQCYTHAPSPVFVSGTGACMLSIAGSQASGTWNVDAGSGDVTLNELVKIFLGGGSNIAPCPTCDGDVPGDGVRGGTCNNGQSDGLSCEATASDPTYPAPGGGQYSLDCLPSTSTNFTGQGIPVSHVETTGVSTLTSGVPCTGSPSMCPCAVCSGNTSLPCSSDAQCASQSAGTCSVSGGGTQTRPNSCSGEACTIGPDGEGECTVPDFNQFCDGLVEEDGAGIIACQFDSDCQMFGYGNCTIDENRKCFASTISATGAADAHVPTTVGITCLPGTINGTINLVQGLPGPGRVRNEWYVTQIP